MSIAYAAGTQYCVLSIPKRKAQQCGIDNPKEVEIQETKNGILIRNKKSADVLSTGLDGNRSHDLVDEKAVSFYD